MNNRDSGRHIGLRTLTALAFAIAVVSIGTWATHAAAQSSSKGTAPARGASPAGSAATTPKIESNLIQLMRGILYPASNVLFAAQDDLKKWPAAPDPAVSPNPLTNTYGGWQAVENASLALAESANLLLIPGRVCSNGKPAPTRRADWIKFTQGLRDAGHAAYKAAQSKSQDEMVDAAGKVSDACAACHDVYREKKGGEKDRCLP